MRSFKEFLVEGNPLARNWKFETGKSKRHLVTLSAERKGKSDKENAERMNTLKQQLKKKGVGYRNTKGMWKGGEEDSVTVYAPRPGKWAGKNLLRNMRKLGKMHDQDSIMHHDGKKGTLIATNKDYHPKKEIVGKQRYNVSNPYGETAYKPRKPADKRPKFTMKDDD